MKRVRLTTANILQKVGIPRHKLHFLEKKGYVRPRLIPMGQLEIRLFAAEDLEKITLLWKYLKEGFSDQIAYQKAMKDLERGKR